MTDVPNKLTTLRELLSCVELDLTLRVMTYSPLFDEFTSAEVLSFEIDDDSNTIILWISDAAPNWKREVSS